MARYRGVADFKPSFLYPAKSAYQLANGCIQPLNQGRLTIACAKEFPDKDMIAMPEGFRGRERTSFTWGASLRMMRSWAFSSEAAGCQGITRVYFLAVFKADSAGLSWPGWLFTA